METVNHVLDFTKLSGGAKAGAAEAVIRPVQYAYFQKYLSYLFNRDTRVDLAQLIEEATEGCWIGHRARNSSEIGSVYSPQKDEDKSAQNVFLGSQVETVVDIAYRSQVSTSPLSSCSLYVTKFLFRVGMFFAKREVLDAV